MLIGQTKKLLNRLNRIRRRTSDGWMINVFVVFSVVFFLLRGREVGDIYVGFIAVR